MSNFYLCVELAGADAPAVRAALAEFIYPDEYDLEFQGDKFALEVWTCAQAKQTPLIAAVHDLVRRFASDRVTAVYVEDDRGSTEQYLGPWRAVMAHLTHEHQTRLATLNAAYQRQVQSLTHAESREAFVITEGW